MVKIQVTGVSRTLKAIGKTKGELKITLAQALEKASGVVLRKALYYVPVDLKDLHATGKVVTEGKGLGAESRVEFGGTAPSGRDVYYAYIVHEVPEYYHAPPTCYKYLERAGRETRGTIASIVKREVQVKT